MYLFIVSIAFLRYFCTKNAQFRELYIRPYTGALPMLVLPHKQCGQDAVPGGDVFDNCA